MLGPDSMLTPQALASIDQRVFLRNVSWAQYEALLETRGESAVPRLTYLEGELEIMSPSDDHEFIKKTMARLVEAYADALAIPINGFGSWTIRSRRKRRGLEPDECYVLGEERHPARPDLAIEVIWTSGGLDKLEVYRGLGVREVWFWQDGKITVHELRSDGHHRIKRSKLLPALDLELVAELAVWPSQSAAVRELRRRLAPG